MIFGKIKIEDKPIFDRLLSLNPYVDSEYLFSVFFMWQNVMGYERAIEDECIYIRNNNNGKIQYHFPICHPEKACKNLAILLKEVRETGEKIELSCITNEQLDMMGEEKDHFTVIEKRNYADYLYDGEAIRSLTGKRLHKKRGHVYHFKEKYNWDFRIFQKNDYELQQCIGILQKWEEKKLEATTEEEAKLMDVESDAVNMCMSNFEQLGLIGGIMYIDGEPKGFTVGEVSNRGGISTGIVHYEKCDTGYDGIYQAINQMFAQQALSGVQYINRQEDMGVEGLRRAKLSYYPVRLVDKFTLKEH